MPYLIFLDPSLSGRLRNNWIALKILAQKWNQFQLTQHLFINLKPSVKEMFCSQKFWLLFTLQGDLVSGLLRAGLIESELELQDLTTFLSAVYWPLLGQPMLLLHTLCAKFGSLILKLIHWSSEDGLDVELVTRLAMEDFINVLKGSRHKPQNIFTKVNLKQMALEARQHNLLIEHLNICRWYFAPKPWTRSGISHPKVK